jgi:hypothetical protein
MEREVATLRQQTGVASPRDLDALLGALASALPGDRTPAGLEYTGGDLRAIGLVLSPEELRSVATRLKTVGYTITGQGTALVVAPEDGR